jgi:16S rRNA (cytosine967-C5)-methyltransferase
MCTLSSHRDGLAITGRRAKLAHPFYTSGSWPCRLPPPSPRRVRYACVDRHTRAAAQEVAYGSLRRYGCGEFILRRLLDRTLPHAETEALLLATLYRLHTRPDAAYMVVDQAVSAAGELVGGAFRGLVNAVLRNYLRQREALLTAMADDQEATFQHPAWWLARLRRTYPDCWPELVALAIAFPQ